MVNASSPGGWHHAAGYEAYMGRWSRPMAADYLTWLAAPSGARWLDVGCGTGAVSGAVLELADPASTVGIDLSAGFIRTASETVTDHRASFKVGDACSLPFEAASFDVVVAGLVLNHIPESEGAVIEMARVAMAGGLFGAYVWDYSGEMQLVRYFWEAVATSDREAARHDPRAGYLICQPDPLASLFRAFGLDEVQVSSIDLPMRFRDFDDFWRPHTMAGPAAPQRYVAALSDDRRNALREKLRELLPIGGNGEIHLIGRAWAVRGTKGDWR